MTPEPEEHVFHGEIIPPEDDDDSEFQAHKAWENLIRKCGSRTRALKFWHEVPKEHGYDR